MPHEGGRERRRRLLTQQQQQEPQQQQQHQLGWVAAAAVNIGCQPASKGGSSWYCSLALFYAHGEREFLKEKKNVNVIKEERRSGCWKCCLASELRLPLALISLLGWCGDLTCSTCGIYLPRRRNKRRRKRGEKRGSSMLENSAKGDQKTTLGEVEEKTAFFNLIDTSI